MKVELTHFRMLDNFHIKAVASILVDGQLAVHDIRIVEYAAGKTIVAMPNRLDGHGVYRDTVHPINQELRQQINDLLLGEYNRWRNDRCFSVPTK